MSNIIFSSDKLNRLNTVKFYYTDGSVVGSLFADSSNPLYLADERLPSLSLGVNTESLWSGDELNATKKILGFMDFMRGTDFVQNNFGNWGDISGTLDLKQKFVYTGSKPQSFVLNGIIFNRQGWNISIKPQLEKLMDFILPSRLREADADMVVDTAKKIFGGAVSGVVNLLGVGETTSAKSVVAFLEKGIEHGYEWVGKPWLLKAPQQFNDLSDSSKDMKMIIGRQQINDVYIESVNITLPRSYMANLQGEVEPDCVKIGLTVKTLRQTTTSTIKF